ncbi:hypothetical protein [Actinoplanes utahensis]|uniref:CHAT domain-containing protein n=1 Tax=Actinoplanes utahensis TaxID=1869 RepID=A0A0A6UK02_ACTUT|nr:hypothetical protein [Actinoplanes utahensis]KHD75383.1 hypothetical protein MB27_23425 [Actinoplanes utahensis]GIF33703.1 hypothetical protein Aut01nite_66890 [Actinoplanes utahensis]
MPENEDLRSMVERGADLTNRYLRAGPGSVTGRPYLDQAITVLEQAYQRIEPGEALRGQVAGQLGWLYGVRHLAHGGTVQDRTTAVHLLDESLRFPNQAPVVAGGSKIVLGQLLLAGPASGMNSPDAMMRLMTGGQPTDLRDVDRAIALFREVADGPQISAEMVSSARTLVTVGEALRGMLGGPGGMDFSKLGQALAAAQSLQQQMGGSGMPVPPMPDMSSFSGFRPPAATTPPPATEEPHFGFAERAEPDMPFDVGRVAVVDGPVPDSGPLPRRRPAPIPATPAAELRALLSVGPDALLEGRDPATVDDHVALTAAIAEAPGARPADHLALAAALIARHHTGDGTDWRDVPDDRWVAARSFDRAAPDLPALTPDAVRVAARIAAELPRPARFDAAFAEVTAAMRDAGIGALVFPSLALDAATGRFAPVPDGTRWTGRVAATVPVDGDATVSYVRTAAELLTLIRRGHRPIAEAAVFVANPRRDRETATMDALRLRRAFYPTSTGLGQTIEQSHGDGTAAEVEAHLNASMLHLGCGVTADGALELAGSEVLAPSGIATTTGGVAILPPDPNAVKPLAEALLTRGFTAAVGFTEAIPDRVASLLYWMLHASLVDDGLAPAEAVAAVRAWLRDPDRKPPELLAAEYLGVTATFDLDDPAYARALICRGY